MTLVGIRAALISQLVNVWPGAATTKVITENTEAVDPASMPDLFVICTIRFLDAVQANIDPNPFHRTYGTLVFSIYQRLSTGTVDALTCADSLSDSFKFKTLGGVHLGAPRPGNEITKGGWFSTDLRLSFYADSNT